MAEEKSIDNKFAGKYRKFIRVKPRKKGIRLKYAPSEEHLAAMKEHYDNLLRYSS
jgi:hypothetical protein